MKLLKGINRDNNPSQQPSDTWRTAKNLVIDPNGQLMTEKLASTLSSGSSTIISVCTTAENIIIFDTYDDSGTTIARIKRLDLSGSVYVSDTILATQYLTFDEDYPIIMRYYYNYKGDLVIMWHAENDIPRILNIDDLPFLLDDDNEVGSELEMELTKLFISFEYPEYNKVEVYDNGGSLSSGVYQISIQYQLPDKSYGSFIGLSNPIFINRFNSQDDWYKIMGSEPGTVTTKGFKVTISNIDNKYSTYRVGIIYKNAGVITAYLGQDNYIENEPEVYIASITNLPVISVADILTDNVYLNKVKASTVLHSRLFLANVEEDDELEYQQYACNIVSEFIFDKGVALDAFENSYKDESVLFLDKSFMPDEVIALYIRFYGRKDNAPSKAFHIPGRVVTTPEKTKTTDAIALDIYEDAKVFHFEDTSDVANNGLGAWENETEIYPDDEQFDGTEVGGTIDLRGEKVRHHKLPSVYGLIDGGIDPIDGVGTTSVKNKLVTFSNMEDRVTDSFYKTFSTDIGEVWNKGFRNTSSSALNCKLTFYIQASAPFELGNAIWIHATILHKNSGGSTLTTIIDIDTPFRMEQTRTVEFTMAANDYVDFDFHNDVVLLDKFSRWTGSLTIQVEQVTTTSSLDGKVLGIKLSNIQIPESIRKEYSHFELLYAERNLDNSTVISSGLLRDNSDSVTYPDHRVLHSFDLMFNKLSLNISHMKLQYYADARRVLAGSTVSLDPAFGASPAGELYKVNKSKYIQQDSNWIEPSNLNREGHISVEFEDNGSTIVAPTVPTEGADESAIFSICSFKKDVYKSLFNQKLVRTGKLIKTDTVKYNGYGILTFTGQPLDTETVTIGSKVYTFQTTLTDVDGNVKIGATTADSIDNLIAAINLDTGAGTLYATSMTANSSLTEAVIGDGTTILVYSLEGITIASTETLTNASWGATTIKASFDIYGGDTVHILYGVHGFLLDTDDKMLYNLIPVFSTSNIAYRWANENDITEVFYPYFNLINDLEGPGSLLAAHYGNVDKSYEPAFSNDSRFVQIASLQDGFVRTDSSTWINIWNLYEFFGYSNDFNSINNIEPILVYNPNIDNITIFPYRIYMSNPIGTESSRENWRIFKTNSYYNSVTDKGEIWALDTDGKNLLIEHKYSLYVAKRLDELKFANGIAVALGSAELFDTKPEEIIIDKDGYIGCQSRHASFRCPYGNLIIDRQRGKIFLYNGGKAVEISKLGLQQWFNNNLQYSGIASNEGDDNPYKTPGITALYDSKYERILISKSEASYRWCMSFYPERAIWVSEHDHIVTGFAYNRFGSFFTTNSGGTYYIKQLNKNSQTEPSYIDVVFNDPKTVNKFFESVMWNTIVKLSTDIVDEGRTFTSAIVYNYNKHSGLVPLTVYTFPDGNVRREGGLWKFNDFRNMLKTSKLIIDENTLTELQFTTVTGGDLETDWTLMERFVDDFIIVRLIYDNASSSKIIINEVAVNASPKLR